MPLKFLDRESKEWGKLGVAVLLHDCLYLRSFHFGKPDCGWDACVHVAEATTIPGRTQYDRHTNAHCVSTPFGCARMSPGVRLSQSLPQSPRLLMSRILTLSAIQTHKRIISKLKSVASLQTLLGLPLSETYRKINHQRFKLQQAIELLSSFPSSK